MEATSPLEWCGVTRWTPNSLDRHTESPSCCPSIRDPRATIWCPWGRQQNLYKDEAHIHNLIGGSHQFPSSQSWRNHQDGARLHNLIGGAQLVPVTPGVTRMTNDELRLQLNHTLGAVSRMEGKIKSLWWKCRSRSPLFIPWRAMGFEWLEREILELGACNNGGDFFLGRGTQPEEEGGAFIALPEI